MGPIPNRPHPCRTFLATLSLWLVMCPPAHAREELEGGDSVDERILQSIVVVESGRRRGLGFLVDGSGLIITASGFGRTTPHVIVRLDERRRVLARALADDPRSPIAVLRVAPEAVAGIVPLALPEPGARPRPRKDDRVTVIRGPGPGSGPRLVPARLTLARGVWLAHDASLTTEDVGGPVLDARGMVIGVVTTRSEEEPKRWARAAPIRSVLPVLDEARDEAALVEPPPAGVWPDRKLAGAPGGAASDAGDHYRDAEDYRIRGDEVSLEFLTPPLIRSLLDEASFPPVVGEAPWQWQRIGPLTDRVVILQVVPDLRWTGGSYVRVTGRIISYPLLAGFTVGLFLLFAFVGMLGGGGDMPDLLTPTAPLWRPARAAYHFKGDFLQASLLRDGVEVPPVSALRNCATMEVWIARKASMKPRWRKVRGCWGSYSYPAEAFAPGATLEVRLFEEGNEEAPRIVPLAENLASRLWADSALTPTDTAPCCGADFQ